MKWLIASDIHGSAYYCRKLSESFKVEKADKLLLLGDILYHGPRNDLPKGYAPKEVIDILNDMRKDILCVRGNCDTEVDQMVLNFPILADYAIINEQGTMIYATHGHKYNSSSLPPVNPRDILLHGHTHVPVCKENTDHIYINPGSVSIPKENSPYSYMILENGVFYWKELETGRVYMQYNIE